MPNKTVILMRHAKSAWDTEATTDFARPLNQRGRKNAPQMADWLSAQNWVPDHVICSTAVRTRETLMLMCAKENWQKVDATFEDNLYMASVQNIMQAIDSHIDDHNCLMLVAHNPGLELALLECFPNLEIPLDRKIMPSAAVAVIDWSEKKQLLALQRPRNL